MNRVGAFDLGDVFYKTATARIALLCGVAEERSILGNTVCKEVKVAETLERWPKSEPLPPTGPHSDDRRRVQPGWKRLARWSARHELLTDPSIEIDIARNTIHAFK